MSGRFGEVDGASVLVIQPGDRVLVALSSNDLAREHGDDMRGMLAERFPGVEFTIVAGVTALARVVPASGGVS